MRIAQNRNAKEMIRANVDAGKRQYEDKLRREVEGVKQEKRD